MKCYHTLSLQINPRLSLQPGDGVIGWVAKNRQPVNIAQFDRDTRNLKLYLKDEGIKSFLAVPVGDAGVICVDSKRNYVFTEKNQKILLDFAQVILNQLRSLAIGCRETAQGRTLDFLFGINALSQQNHGLQEYYQKILKPLSPVCQCRFRHPGPPARKGDRYLIAASEGKLFAPLKKTSIPVDMGLTGWVIREKKPLVRR